jgi:S-adenosylmethionine-dependent methyltransferase
MAYSPDDVRSLFDRIAAQGDQLEKQHFLRNEIPRAFIKKYIRPSDTVLDAGGGAGINAILMARMCQSVTLVDISPKMLALAATNSREAHMLDRIGLFEGDITHLEQCDDAACSFVVAVAGAISHALEKGFQAVQELPRASQKGALLIIGCDSKYGLMRHFLRYDDDLLDETTSIFETGEYLNNGEVRARLYTVAEMVGMLKRAGCEIVEVASTPMIISSLDERRYHEEAGWEKLKALEL